MVTGTVLNINLCTTFPYPCRTVRHDMGKFSYFRLSLDHRLGLFNGEVKTISAVFIFNLVVILKVDTEFLLSRIFISNRPE